ncbi:tape measure protein [Stutzerimonas zhaodongensis]|jgi:tape measure domain-containing protein|uniref:Tape measure protein n=1 Tax=Stutzerimonas zhaodongensis TaxID=1176257 RepID=A0ABX8INW3_9GAMM|nr:tape measure protein [Stutzerimonas zhaodongensis]QWV15471.1 tape measure protein [Stutzerimonas zhaodongensis]
MSTIKTQLVIDGKNNSKKAFDEVNTQLETMNKRMAANGKALVALLSGAAVVGAAKGYARLADESNQLQARLKLATDSQQEFNKALEDVRRIANENGASLTAVTQLYARLTPVLREAGRSQDDVAKITEAMTKALRISGASAAESESAITQFSQALGAGAFRGEEFNSVAEAAPRLMQALADSIGVPVGKLREMAGAGELTAEVVSGALLDQLPKLTREAAEMGETFGASGQQLSNSAVEMVGAFDKMTGASQKATQAMNDLASAMAKVSSGEFADHFREEKQTIGGLNTAISLQINNLRELNNQRKKLQNGNWFEKMALQMRGVTEESIDAEERQTRRQIQALRDRLDERKGINQEISAEEQAHNARMATLKGQSLKDLRSNLAAEEKAQKSANTAMERLKADRLKIEEEFSSSIAKTRSGAAGDPTFSGAMDLKVGAKQALGGQDGERALTQARQALSILEELEASGVNTYGFVGIKQELQEIALAANDLQQKQAQASIEQIGSSIDSLKSKIENVPKVKVGFEYSDADDAAIKQMVDALAADLKKRLTIPVSVTGQGASVSSDVPDLPQFATGGYIRGPGTGTSDSIPALLSNGEYVIRAAAVRKLGLPNLDWINKGLPIPRFADGGMVGTVATVWTPVLRIWGASTSASAVASQSL